MASASESALAPRNKYKLVVIGDESVGKTSIITRFMYDSFESTYKVTIGIDFVSKNLYLSDRVVRLQLWDTAGQERFRSLIPSYIRDSSVAIVVFDVTSRVSFTNAAQWLEDVRKQRGSDALIVIVGNKADMEDRRQVSADEAASFARKENLLYMETSAKTGHNVKQLFTEIAGLLPGGQNVDPSGTGVHGRGGLGAASNAGGMNGAGRTVNISLPPTKTDQPATSGGCGCM